MSRLWLVGWPQSRPAINQFKIPYTAVGRRRFSVYQHQTKSDAPVSLERDADQGLMDALRDAKPKSYKGQGKVMKAKRKGPKLNRSPDSIFRNAVMDIARIANPAGDMHMTVFVALDRLKRAKVPMHIIETKLIPNVEKYTSSLETARAQMLVDMACQNVTIALALVGKRPYLSEYFRDSLYTFLINRSASPKTRGSLEHITNLMRSVSIVSNNFQIAVAQLRKGRKPDGHLQETGHAALARQVEAGERIERAVQLLRESGLVQLEHDMRKWQRQLISVVHKLRGVQRKVKRRTSKLSDFGDLSEGETLPIDDTTPDT